MHKHKKGTLSELTVSQDLIREGYDVFWNIEGSGPVDLVAVHKDTGTIRLIDVKSVSHVQSTGRKLNRYLTPTQKRIGVEIIEVDLNEHFDI